MHFREFICLVWHGNNHDWYWYTSINEKNPSGWKCRRCEKRG